MKKNNKAILTFSIVLLAILLIFSTRNYSFDIKVNADKPIYSKGANIKITSQDTIQKIKLYKKTGEKYILFYIGKPNAKEVTINIPDSLLSEESKTDIKVVAVNDKDEIGNSDGQIDKIVPKVSMNPEETAKPSWTPPVIPTKPTPSPSASPSSSEGPSPVQNEQISSDFDSYSFAKKEDTAELKAKSKDGKSLSYSSSNEEVATVDKNGKITAKKAGTTEITIKEDGGTSKKVKIVVPEIRSREDALQPWYDAMKAQRDATTNSKYGWDGSKQTIEGSKVKGTCITFPSVSLQRAGLLDSGEYVTSQNGTNFSNSLKQRSINIIKRHSKSLEYIDLGSGKTANELGNDLKKGDIVNYSTHTQVYMGKNKEGKRLYNTAGRIYGGNSNKAKLNHASSSYDNKKIGMIFRIKTYNVYASCKNGTVSGNNKYMAMQDAKITYKPDSGKKLKSVTVDGKQIDISKHPTEYTVKNIQAEHNIEIIFE